MSTDAIEIEIDNFVSPDAATDVPPDEFVPLEIGDDRSVPAALAPALPEVADVAPLAIATSVQTSDVVTTPGSVRMGGYVAPDARGAAFDDSALTPTEIAIREENRRRSAEHAARMRANAARDTAAPMPGTDDTNAVILAPVVATIATTDKPAGLKLAWNPADRSGFEIARDTVIAHLDTHGMADLAPGIPASKGQFGKVMKSFNNADARTDRGENDRLMARCVTRRDYERMGKAWPTTLESRYVIGFVDTTDDLGSLGDKSLVCSLVETYPGSNDFEIQFTGGTDRIRQAVEARFAELIDTAALNVTTMLQWYTDTLTRRFNAVRCGYAMLIVDDGSTERAKLIERAEAFANALQGANPYDASEIMGRRLDVEKVVSREGYTWQSFCVQMASGMLQDVKNLGKEFAKEWALAQEAARKAESARPDATEASIELATRRALIGSERANAKHHKLLATLTALQARATALVEVIGRVHAAPAIQACEAMRAEWTPRCYGTLDIELD